MNFREWLSSNFWRALPRFRASSWANLAVPRTVWLSFLVSGSRKSNGLHSEHTEQYAFYFRQTYDCVLLACLNQPFGQGFSFHWVLYNAWTVNWWTIVMSLIDKTLKLVDSSRKRKSLIDHATSHSELCFALLIGLNLSNNCQALRDGQHKTFHQWTMYSLFKNINKSPGDR